MAYFLTGLSISVSEINRILHQLMTFFLDQLTLKMRKKLLFLLNYREHKLPNEFLPTDPNSAKKKSSGSQTNTYGGNNIGEIEDYLALSDKNKELSDA